jgi:hypothetical protein
MAAIADRPETVKANVPRRKKGDDSPPRSDIAVKIDELVYRRAKAVSGFRGITLAEYLSELLDGPVARDFEQLHKVKRHPEAHP